MTEEKLGRSNYLKSEIKKLDDYLWYESRSPFINLYRKILKITSSGALNSFELDINHDLKLRIREVIQNYKKELEDEFRKL